jgi:hypothetical protein
MFMSAVSPNSGIRRLAPRKRQRLAVTAEPPHILARVSHRLEPVGDPRVHIRGHEADQRIGTLTVSGGHTVDIGAIRYHRGLWSII